MSNTVPAQHPAVVLRSTYQHLRAMLAIATIAVVGLTVAVVVLAINSNASTSVTGAARASSPAIRTNPSSRVEPNPDQQGVAPATRSTLSAIHANPSPAVEPNPDQQP
jgi:ABC-type lipoprotein release transport system permease subunit